MTRPMLLTVALLLAARAAGAQPPALPKPKPRALTAADSGRLLTFNREQFSYDAGARRDPFLSPLASGEAKPLLADLIVTGIIFDAAGRRSVAVMRDVSDKTIYRVRAGDLLGRARVARIAQRAVHVTVDEFGFVRQDSLLLSPQVAPQAGPAGPPPAPNKTTRTP